VARSALAGSDRVGAPVLSRHHAAGAESARGLLFTILGEFVLPSGGTAWTASFLDLLARLDVEEKASRQALMRTSTGGWLEAERVGRRTRWHLTPQAIALLTEGTERIFGFRGTQPDWDGRWIVVLARVPERDRAARHLLRTRLVWAGFGSVSPGVWLSSHAERRQDAERVLADAGVLGDALILDSHLVAGLPAEAVVAQAWDLAAVQARYADFVRAFADYHTDDPLVRLTELVHAWRRFPWLDPALPPTLLPADWLGAKAARVFVDRHERWVRGARASWAALDAGPT
jgi:phenylacetic acid degradation operon negative regulatory protein